MTTFLAHRENVPGDFYVEDGCCLTCAVPFTVAPDLFAWTKKGNEQCIVCKQPSTPEELDRMLLAFEVADMGCIRYKGIQRTVQMRLVEAREGKQCDDLPLDLLAKASATVQVPDGSFTSDLKAMWSAVTAEFSAIKKWWSKDA